jgi:cysteine-rich repeat protein
MMCTDDVISTCVMGESGCYEYNVADDCAAIGWICDEVEGQLECVLPPPVVETEPNDACEFANALNASGRATGAVTSGDADWYSFEITDVAADVRIETFGANFTGCSGDTVVTLYGSDCTTVIGENDDEGTGLCSLVDPRVDDFAVLLETGVYYVKVSGAFQSTTVPAYSLDVKVGLPECGNGALEREEDCDDANDDDADGCNSNCQIQQGWSCSGSPSVCAERPAGDICSNAISLDTLLGGAKTGTFGPHDTASFANDYSGFSNTTCPVNGGTGGTAGAGRDIVFSVTVQPGEILTASMPNNSFDEFIALLNDCSTVGPTTCLYADDTPGDITYTNATQAAQTLFIIADGWGSTDSGTFSLQVSLRTSVCGDGTIEGTERCDAGEAGSAGCNATTCQIEAGFVCSGAPSVCVAEGVGNTCATAQHVTVGTYTGSLRGTDGYTNMYNNYAAPCSTSNTVGNDRVYAIEVPNNHQLSASYASTGYDGVLVLSSSCDALTSQCLARVDDANVGGIETRSYTNNSGATQTVFVVLDAWSTASGDFSLTLGLTDVGSLTFESEPNGTCAEADSVNLEDRIIGSISPGDDQDYFVFTLSERRSVTVQTAGSAGIGAACPGDTQIDLYGDSSCSTSLAYSDDVTGIGLCSRIVRTLDPGTYRVRVRSFGSSISDYSLNVVTAPAP